MSFAATIAQSVKYLCFQPRATSLALTLPSAVLKTYFVPKVLVFLGTSEIGVTATSFIASINVVDTLTLVQWAQPSPNLLCIFILSSILPEAGTLCFFTFHICLLVTSFVPAMFILGFFRNCNWCTDCMPTTATGIAFFSDPKQCVLSFSLPKTVSPCFAALLNNVFPSVRFPFTFLCRPQGRLIVLVYSLTDTCCAQVLRFYFIN